MKKIKEIITECNMSQKEFAGYFGIPLRTVQEWAQGRRVPPEYVVSMIIRIIELENFMGKIVEFKQNESTDMEVQEEARRISSFLEGNSDTEFEFRKGEREYNELLGFLNDIHKK